MNVSTIWKTLKVTSNPTTGLLLRFRGKREAITFRNHVTLNLTWPQFRVFRDNYQYFSKYTVSQLGEDFFRVSKQNSEVSCESELLPLVFELMQDYAIQQTNKLFHLKNREIELFGSLDMLFCIRELKSGEYQYDYKDKVVLDVGGFEGESTAYFWQKGAKKIIVYEPVQEHIEFIRKNVAINHIKAEIHQSGIGDIDEIKTVEYERTDPGFGILNHGSKTVQIELKNISKVIEESGAQVAKFDCEGGEISLLNVHQEVLREIEYYIIETHSPEINRAIKEKFVNSGFILEKENAKPPTEFFILAFRRSNNYKVLNA